MAAVAANALTREHAGALKAVPSIVLAGGGSAGHTSPLIATADALRRLDPTVEILALGTERGLETRVVPEAGYRLELIPPVPLPRKPTPALLAVPGKMLASVGAARKALDEAKADVLVGFGGYVSTPAYVAAWRRKTPIVVHEGNAVPGIANKFAARYCTQHVKTSFPGTRSAARRVRRPADPARDLHAGPGRAAGRGAAVLRAGPGRAHAVRDGRFTGRAAAERGVRRCRRGPAGSRHPGAARDRSEEHARRRRRPAHCRTSFCRTSTGWTCAYAAADLAVCRSGANTVTEVSGVGLPAIYVPLPHGNGEQALNAKPVVDAGGGLLVDNATVIAGLGSCDRSATSARLRRV